LLDDSASLACRKSTSFAVPSGYGSLALGPENASPPAPPPDKDSPIFAEGRGSKM
jgi:hypothetical protein